MEEIPKVIHYCWFGRGVIPASQKKYIESWKRIMPRYKIKCWNEDNFDVNICAFSGTAYKLKKYSMVSDVARLFALYTEGGIYMDTDVKVLKPLDEFLIYDFFSAIEVYPTDFEKNKHLIGKDQLPIDKSKIFTGSLAILAAVIGSKKNNLLVKDTFDYFVNQPFVFADGSLNVKLINPAILAHKAIKYGFKYEDKRQYLDNNMLILSSTIFASKESSFCKETYLMHYGAQSWVNKNNRELFLFELDKLNLLQLYKSYISIKRGVIKMFKSLY